MCVVKDGHIKQTMDKRSRCAVPELSSGSPSKSDPTSAPKLFQYSLHVLHAPGTCSCPKTAYSISQRHTVFFSIVANTHTHTHSLTACAGGANACEALAVILGSEKRSLNIYTQQKRNQDTLHGKLLLTDKKDIIILLHKRLCS